MSAPFISLNYTKGGEDGRTLLATGQCRSPTIRKCLTMTLIHQIYIETSRDLSVQTNLCQTYDINRSGALSAIEI